MTMVALGIAGEGGEVADHIKKCLYQGHDLENRHLLIELGDLLWYITIGAVALGSSLEQVAQMNVDKLKARYKSGAFTKDESINRVENKANVTNE